MRVSVQIEFDKTLDLISKKHTVVVGRATHCDIVIPHKSISREHCRIEYIKEKNEFYITDIGSSNGVFINNQRCVAHTRMPIDPNLPLSLGSLECQVSEIEEVPIQIDSKGAAPTPPGGATSTVRISRIELNRPSITLAAEKKPKKKRARNPITDNDDDSIEVKKSFRAPIIATLFVICSFLFWYYYL